MKKDIWQLFVGGTMMTAARWPNAKLDDGSVWDQDATWGWGGTASEHGTMATRTGNGRPAPATGDPTSPPRGWISPARWPS